MCISRKRKQRKKKKAAALLHGLQESPSAYAPGPSSSGVSTAEKTGNERGIETMYRSAYLTQLDLTNLADNKAI